MGFTAIFAHLIENHLMLRRSIQGLSALLLICSVSIFFGACKTTKVVPYFSDFPDTARPAVTKTVPFKNPLIQPDDVLSITLQTIDNIVSAPVNTTNASDVNSGGSGAGAGGQNVSGYLVDKNGEVELPFIGKIKLSGLTTAEARDTIAKAADKLFNDPIVNVRLVNFKITVLGEVNRPSTYVMPSEKVTLFDAIGLAGDLTLYGRRENVLLVRDSTGENRQMVRLNLNSKNIMSSPYFYLQPNDLIYVEPNKDRIIGSDAVTGRRLTILTVTLSTVTTLALILSRL